MVVARLLAMGDRLLGVIGRNLPRLGWLVVFAFLIRLADVMIRTPALSFAAVVAIAAVWVVATDRRALAEYREWRNARNGVRRMYYGPPLEELRADDVRAAKRFEFDTWGSG